MNREGRGGSFTGLWGKVWPWGKFWQERVEVFKMYEIQGEDLHFHSYLCFLSLSPSLSLFVIFRVRGVEDWGGHCGRASAWCGPCCRWSPPAVLAGLGDGGLGGCRTAVTTTRMEYLQGEDQREQGGFYADDIKPKFTSTNRVLSCAVVYLAAKKKIHSVILAFIFQTFIRTVKHWCYISTFQQRWKFFPTHALQICGGVSSNL